MCFRLSTQKRYKAIKFARCDVSWTLCAYYKHTRLRYFRSSFHFDAFLSVHTNTVCLRFCFDPLLRAFSNRCVFDENAQCVRVDGRPKPWEMILWSLRFHDGDGHQNLAWKLNLFSISNAITPTHLLCQMQENSFWAEFLPKKRHIQRQKKKENLAVACLRPP